MKSSPFSFSHVASRFLQLLLVHTMLWQPSTAHSVEVGIAELLLQPDQWNLTVIPGDSTQLTLRELFISEELSADGYRHTWAIFLYDPMADKYVQPELDSYVPAGRAFWIIQGTGDEVAVQFPDLSTPSLVSSDQPCADTNGCYAIGIESGSDQAAWNMLGSPTANSTQFGRVRFQEEVQEAACEPGCNFEEASQNGLILGAPWLYLPDENRYSQISASTAIPAGHGFWVNIAPDVYNARMLAPSTQPALVEDELNTLVTAESVSVLEHDGGLEGLAVRSEGADSVFQNSAIFQRESASLSQSPVGLLATPFELMGVTTLAFDSHDMFRISAMFDLDDIPDTNGDGLADLHSLVLYESLNAESDDSSGPTDLLWGVSASPALIKSVQGSERLQVDFLTSIRDDPNGIYAIGIRTDDSETTIADDSAIFSASNSQRKSAGDVSCTRPIKAIRVENVNGFTGNYRYIRSSEYICTSSAHSQKVRLSGVNLANLFLWYVKTPTGVAEWAFETLSFMETVARLPNDWEAYEWKIELSTDLKECPTETGVVLGCVDKYFQIRLFQKIDGDTLIRRGPAKNNLAHEMFHVYQAMSYYDSRQLPYTASTEFFKFAAHRNDWWREGTAVWFADEVHDIPVEDISGLSNSVLDMGLWATSYNSIGVWKLIDNTCSGSSEQNSFFSSNTDLLPLIFSYAGETDGGSSEFTALLAAQGCALHNILHEYNIRTKRDGNFSAIESDEDFDTEKELVGEFTDFLEESQNLTESVYKTDASVKEYEFDEEITIEPGGVFSFLVPGFGIGSKCGSRITRVSLFVEGGSALALVFEADEETNLSANAQGDFSVSLLYEFTEDDTYISLVNSGDSTTARDVGIKMTIKVFISRGGLVILDEQGNCRL